MDKIQVAGNQCKASQKQTIRKLSCEEYREIKTEPMRFDEKRHDSEKERGTQNGLGTTANSKQTKSQG